MGRVRSPQVFVLASGQDDNLGDVVLRREYLVFLRQFGPLHIFVGEASDDFVDGLDLDVDDRIYRNLRRWHRSAWWSLLAGGIWFVDKPGELQLDARTFRRQLKLLPLVVTTRLRRGQILRLGMAVRSKDGTHLRALRLMFRLSTRVRWRDTFTGSLFGFGEVGPDWAFRWDDSTRHRLAPDPRDVVVSYRGDRETPSDELLSAVTDTVRGSGRRLVVVTQVRRDAARSAELAARLGADLIPFPPDRTHTDQEHLLRQVYRNSALVISDRLHVLILAMTEGAVPICLTDSPESKVGRHFDAIGFLDSAVTVEDAGQPLEAFIGRQIDRRSEALDAWRRAKGHLEELAAGLGPPQFALAEVIAL